MEARGNKRKDQKRSQGKAGKVRVLRPSKQAKLNASRVIVLGAIVYFAIWTAYPATYRMEQKHELNKLKKQLTQINQQNTELRKEIKYLNSDEYVEQGARSLGLSRPDEEVVIVIPDDSKKPEKGAVRKPNNKKVKPQENLLQTLTNLVLNIFSINVSVLDKP